jgi:hypothetical protein
MGGAVWQSWGPWRSVTISSKQANQMTHILPVILSGVVNLTSIKAVWKGPYPPVRYEDTKSRTPLDSRPGPTLQINQKTWRSVTDLHTLMDSIEWEQCRVQWSIYIVNKISKLTESQIRRHFEMIMWPRYLVNSYHDHIGLKKKKKNQWNDIEYYD